MTKRARVNELYRILNLLHGPTPTRTHTRVVSPNATEAALIRLIELLIKECEE